MGQDTQQPILSYMSQQYQSNQPMQSNQPPQQQQPQQQPQQQQPQQQPQQQQPQQYQPYQPIQQYSQPQQYQQYQQYQPIQQQTNQTTQLQQPVYISQQQPIFVNSLSKYKVVGTPFKGYQVEFPFELTNAMAKQDYQAVIQEINEAAKYKRGTFRFFSFILIFSIVFFFFIFIPNLLALAIILPITITFMAISIVVINVLSNRIQKRIACVVENFNSVYVSRGVYFEFCKKSLSKFNLTIVYPTTLSIFPQIIGQPMILQQPNIAANENSSLLNNV